MKWHDKLCGHEVTPEDWNGGVVQEQMFSQYGVMEYQVPVSEDGKLGGHFQCQGKHWCTHSTFLSQDNNPAPIFPSKAWCDVRKLSLDEVWHRLRGGSLNQRIPWTLYKTSEHRPGPATGCRVSVSIQGDVMLKHSVIWGAPGIVEDMPALLLALTNAQVLAASLAEWGVPQ